MKLTRRRFLAITGGFAIAPSVAQAVTWTGHAFGAEVSIRLSGPRPSVEAALAEARRLIAEVEGHFSLFDAGSEVSRLNATGRIVPSARFHALLSIADAAYRTTRGLFDPTVQPLWLALHHGTDVSAARRLVGWDRVHFDSGSVELSPGQALTLNGIAQGYATDLVTEALAQHGFTRTLVNIGEFRGTAGPWRLGVEDPVFGLVAQRSLRDGAIATSSPMATALVPDGHIVHRQEQPRWSTVSVEAETAALADALSTGLSLADLPLVKEVRKSAGVRRITLVDQAGDVTTL